MRDYYMLVEEWDYPTESGREPVSATFDYKKEALAYAKELCEKEAENYQEATGCDSSPVTRYQDEDDETKGYIITDKQGREPFYYCARLLEIKPLTKGNLKMNYSEMTHTQLLKEFVRVFTEYNTLRDDELSMLSDKPNRDFWDEEDEKEYVRLLDEILVLYLQLEDMAGYIKTL